MNKTIPCPLCGIPLEIRESVKSKPYVICNSCGMQMFIRKESGIEKLKKILSNGTSLSNPAIDKLHEKVQSLENLLSQAEQKYQSSKNAHAELLETKSRLREKDQAITRAQNGIRDLQDRVSELEELVLRTCPECGEEFEIREDLIRTS